jgi:hypothetical protein
MNFRSRLVLLLLATIMSSGDAATPPARITLAFAAAASAGNTGGTNNGSENADETNSGNEGHAIPRLGEADPNKDIPTLRLGETITFEEMGPVIVNVDGTTRRINNWNDLSDKEREVTWRRIAKRNEERRKKLLEEMQRQEDIADDTTGDSEEKVN